MLSCCTAGWNITKCDAIDKAVAGEFYCIFQISSPSRLVSKSTMNFQLGAFILFMFFYLKSYLTEQLLQV